MRELCDELRKDVSKSQPLSPKVTKSKKLEGKSLEEKLGGPFSALKPGTLEKLGGKLEKLQGALLISGSTWKILRCAPLRDDTSLKEVESFETVLDYKIRRVSMLPDRDKFLAIDEGGLKLYDLNGKHLETISAENNLPQADKRVLMGVALTDDLVVYIRLNGDMEEFHARHPSKGDLITLGRSPVSITSPGHTYYVSFPEYGISYPYQVSRNTAVATADSPQFTSVTVFLFKVNQYQYFRVFSDKFAIGDVRSGVTFEPLPFKSYPQQGSAPSTEGATNTWEKEFKERVNTESQFLQLAPGKFFEYGYVFRVIEVVDSEKDIPTQERTLKITTLRSRIPSFGIGLIDARYACVVDDTTGGNGERGDANMVAMRDGSNTGVYLLDLKKDTIVSFDFMTSDLEKSTYSFKSFYMTCGGGFLFANRSGYRDSLLSFDVGKVTNVHEEKRSGERSEQGVRKGEIDPKDVRGVKLTKTYKNWKGQKITEDLKGIDVLESCRITTPEYFEAVKAVVKLADVPKDIQGVIAKFLL